MLLKFLSPLLDAVSAIAMKSGFVFFFSMGLVKYFKISSSLFF